VITLVDFFANSATSEANFAIGTPDSWRDFIFVGIAASFGLQQPLPLPCDKIRFAKILLQLLKIPPRPDAHLNLGRPAEFPVVSRQQVIERLRRTS
jgi:hypothetical protein